ncbi:MAG: response regulator [Herpetosiphonaceae bacterium]|nr:response regulator [Herpetosiphonaceae bacterium]
MRTGTSQYIIAILEHDPLLSMLLGDCLSDAGHDVRLWIAGEAPYDFIEQVQPDLVVMDLWLPHPQEGLAVLTRLGTTPMLRHMPLIVCSVDDLWLQAEASVLHALRCSVLAKPFKLVELRLLVEACLRKAQLRTERQTLVGSVSGAMGALNKQEGMQRWIG